MNSPEVVLAPGRGAGRPFGGASPVLLRIYEILADGEWHRYEEVLTEATKVITPGEARRWAEMRRISSYPISRRLTDGIPPRRRQALDDHDLIRGAKRDIFYERVRNSSHIVLEERSDGRWLKYQRRAGRRAQYNKLNPKPKKR